MIGIVVVSHSRALAEAALDLALQMVQGEDRPTVVIAAGLDDGSLGTDAMAVAEAVGGADSGDGVVVLLDLGSAVLSAEMALEMLDPDIAGRVRLTSAPLVEGLVAATVAASVGGDLDAVTREAERGLIGKQDHLDAATSGPPAAPEEVPTSYDARAEVEVTGAHGLHARPAALLVRTLAAYDASVRLRNVSAERGPVDAHSLSAVATLDARQGHRLSVEASGPDATAAVAAVRDLATRAFGDSVATEVHDPPLATRGSGLDVAVGPAIVLDEQVDLSTYVVGSPDVERERFDAALRTVDAELEDLTTTAATRAGAEHAEVLQAHRALLDDPGVVGPVREAITAKVAAPQAFSRRMDELHDAFAQLTDPYQQARAQDVDAVRHRVLAALTGRSDGTTDERGVLVVDTLDPARAVALDAQQVVGVVTRRGGSTGHGALIARARGIPLYTDAGDLPIAGGDVVAFDARDRRITARPSESERAAYEQLVADRTRERATAEQHAREPVVLADGTTVLVMANVGTPADADGLVAAGADGIGLVRTEVLFGQLSVLPTVDEQAQAFIALARAADGPVTVRTWDVGADKPLPYLPLAAEDNPFLGVRGLRAFRSDPEPLLAQLQAVCVAARQAPVRVMFPMVSRPDEVDWALTQLSEAGRRVGGVPDGLEVGAMIEVPAAALRARDITRRLSFVSIGTNDLTQYVMAAERGNTGVQHLLDAGDPAVLRLIAMVCDEVGPHVEVAVCGDAASRPELAARFVEVGVRELSASPPAVALVKARLRGQ
ncbi:phosphoenolpyruvate--protein phosphotransferase [Luteipulveratus halotolerans]|uniref:phosphoenolpyruvate--protein phosphotransferase n=1 Tax=Luteipulveratus halotolerans TaxID=1631356 RepID=UPI00067FBDF8|nr:phosphoenolpyruvate--protein phosphotransferase [Luteipulveratus halotolerans]